MNLTRLLVLFLIFPVMISAQHYEHVNVQPPLDIPMKLSGTFGELRSNHFHSGIDLKTGERIGLKVYSIADGYVSRIKIQSGGYGKALYITHPDGFVSVYGHLSKYNSTIEEYVFKEQYKHQSYEVDLYPQAGLFQIKQGEVIARSGNSGRSGGPHLHFEIRSAADQKPINPLLFNYNVTDHVSPTINLLRVSPIFKKGQVNNSTIPKDFYTVYNGKHYEIKGKDTIQCSGSMFFGINTFDPFNGGINKNGVFSVELYIDENLEYAHRLSTFSFDETRYINSLIDYPVYKEKSRRVQKSIVEPNNRLSIYTHTNRKGFSVNPGEVHKVRYEIADIAGNTSVLIFWLKGIPWSANLEKQNNTESGPIFSYGQNNTFEKNNLIFEVPGRALYDDIIFQYNTDPEPVHGHFSTIHSLHFETVPLHTWCKLAIETVNLPDHLQEKALIIKIEKKGEPTACGGEYSNGFVHTRIREFGDYCIVADTIPPEITAVNIKKGKSLLAQTSIMMKMEDKLSGIKTYNAYLNGNWILMEYDAKNDLLTYRFDHNLKDGENTFQLVVSDERNNITTYETTLKY